MRAGARGYLRQGRRAGRDRARDLHRARRWRGLRGLARRADRRPAVAAGARPHDRSPQLTEREIEILDLIAAGRNNAQIAGELYLAPKTVRNNVSNILAKLQATDRAEAIIRARDAGLGSPGRE